MSRTVLLISNDVVPGMSLPVAAPGLRTWALMRGLQDHGIAAETVVVRSVVERVWRRAAPPPTPEHVFVEPAGRLGDLIEAQRPPVVIFCNSHHADRLRPALGTRYVYDFFAPKMLEFAYHNEEYDVVAAARLRDRKLRALSLADAVIVNGAKKVPYVLAWLLQGDRDPRSIPVHVVPMGIPVHDGGSDVGAPVRFVMSGYIQPWSQPGGWTQALTELVSSGACSLDLLLGRHWGRDVDEPLPQGLAALLEAPDVRAHPPRLFEEFQQTLGTCDVSIDLFEHNLEREHAMITRTVVALASGLAVVHPTFTELSPVIADAEAGWLVDVEDPEAVAGVLSEIANAPEEVARRKANARRLAIERIEPARTVEPLVELVQSWLA